MKRAQLSYRLIWMLFCCLYQISFKNPYLLLIGHSCVLQGRDEVSKLVVLQFVPPLAGAGLLQFLVCD